jgi:hypothetical protein
MRLYLGQAHNNETGHGTHYDLVYACRRRRSPRAGWPIVAVFDAGFGLAFSV